MAKADVAYTYQMKKELIFVSALFAEPVHKIAHKMTIICEQISEQTPI